MEEFNIEWLSYLGVKIKRSDVKKALQSVQDT
jgi:hypothetical protein